MKKPVLLILLATCLLFGGGASVFAGGDGIYWADSYDDALETANYTGLPIFLLITAPSWCYWCQQLEQNVLSNEDVILAINDGFIPVMVLDTDDDVNRFDFDGYPTVWVLDAYGDVIADIYTQDPYEMMDYLAMYGGGYGYGGDDYAPPVEWEEHKDVAMYGGANWESELYRRSNLTLDQAKALAEEDYEVTFFFYVKGQMALPGKGTFRKGDAVFFSGEPWWGSAPGLADGYVKYYGEYGEDWGGE